MIKLKDMLIAILYFVLVGYFIVSCLMLSKGITDRAGGDDLSSTSCSKEYRYSRFVPAYDFGCWLGAPAEQDPTGDASMDQIDKFFSENWQLIFIASIIVFVASLITLPWLVAKIPEDYFKPTKRHPTQWKTQHPAIRILALLGKNILGIVLLAGGILMLVFPGQGILTMVAGLLLMDYPGKFTLERKLASIPAVFKGLNWLRGKANKPPLLL